MTTASRTARDRGLRLAAKVAGMGGIAFAVVGLVEAQAAQAATAPPPMEPAAIAASRPEGSAPRLPLEGTVIRGGNCGCAPCWGPPAPPARTARRRTRRTVRKVPEKRRRSRPRPRRSAGR
jgi:hypothetical protein